MDFNFQNCLQECTTRGSTELPVDFCSVSMPKDTLSVLVHWHEELEFTKIVQGTLQYDVGEKSYEVGPGDLLLITPNTLHAAKRIGKGGTVTHTVVFHLNLAGLNSEDSCAKRYLQPIARGELFIPPVLHKDDPLYIPMLRCFQNMWDCKDPEFPYRELQFKTQIFTLIELMWKYSVGKVAPAPSGEFRLHGDKIRHALAYMQEHFAEAITIQQLANLCGFSQVHFMNIFKAVVGTSCMDYLLAYRLAQSAEELSSSDRPIMQVALDNGFRNVSYFNRAFKARYQVTPSVYRSGRHHEERSEV